MEIPGKLNKRRLTFQTCLHTPRLSQGHGESGFVALWVLAFLVVLVLSLQALFDSGRLLLEKTRLQQTADATAWSGAVLQARELNFHAYMNRAMVANQVTIGQLVALSSHVQMQTQVWYDIEQLSRLLAPIPVIGPPIRAGALVASRTAGGINFVVQHAGSVLANGADELISVLSLASKAWHAANVISVPEALIEVVNRNDAAIDLNLGTGAQTLIDLRNFANFLHRNDISNTEKTHAYAAYGKKSQDTIRRETERFYEFRSVVLASTDTFVANRSQDFWKMGFIRMRQRGGTHFGKIPGKKHPFYAWSAVDTMSLGFKKGLLGSWDEIPLGWGRQATRHEKEAFSWRSASRNTNWGGINDNPGAAMTVHDRDEIGQGFLEGARGSIEHIGHFKVNRRTLNQGFGALHPQSNKGTIEGLRDFYDIEPSNDLRSKTPAIIDGATPLNIYLKKEVDKISGGAAGSVQLPDRGRFSLSTANPSGPAGQALHALATGRAVFEVPYQQGDAPTLQLANLYSPYWQPKLVSSEDHLLLQLLALMGDQ